MTRNLASAIAALQTKRQQDHDMNRPIAKLRINPLVEITTEIGARIFGILMDDGFKITVDERLLFGASSLEGFLDALISFDSFLQEAVKILNEKHKPTESASKPLRGLADATNQSYAMQEEPELPPVPMRQGMLQGSDIDERSKQALADIERLSQNAARLTAEQVRR